MDIKGALELAKQISRKTMTDLAEEMVRVQPILLQHSVLQQLFETPKDSFDLKEQGYRPVSRLGILWIKRDESEH